MSNYPNKNKSSESIKAIYAKVPPQAKELEAAVLGGIMLERSAFTKVYEILKHYNFYSEANQKIFKVFESLLKKSLPIDLLTVIDELKNLEYLDSVGGISAVVKLTNDIVSTANIESHARIVLQKYIARELIKKSGDIISDAYADGIDPFTLLDNAADKIKDIKNAIAETSQIDKNKIALQVVSDIETKSYNAKNNIIDANEIYTGMKEWDKINGSLFKGGLYIVAARPAMGKGVHMTELICNMGKRYSVGIVNGEMTNKQLIIRIGCNLLSIDNFLWKKNPENITKEEISNVYAAMEATQDLDLHFEDKNDVTKVCNKIRLWVEKYGVQVVLADVLSKFKPPEEIIHRMTDVQKLNYVMDAFANVAKECDIPIILYAHLNRELYKRLNKEPNMSDLKGSGSIEDFAYQVSLLHRPEYYDIQEDEFGESTKGLMYQIVAKHREGETGRIKNKFLPQFSQLKDWEYNTLPNWSPINSTQF